jgi:putative ABC transport system ATP-binding protein
MVSLSPQPDRPAVEAVGVSRLHTDGSRVLRAVDDVSLAVAAGEVVAVIGPSGSGKTTLLHLIGGLDQADEGQVWVTGVEWTSLRGDARASFRRRTCGFVLQGFSLLPQATAAENVEVPMLLDGAEPHTRQRRVAELLERVGLSNEAHKLPDQLSGGQQQRVALARALVNQPRVLLADEPTGSLDSDTARSVLELLLETAQERSASVVLVTHDPTVAVHADRVVRLHSGRLDPESTVSRKEIP